MTNNKDNAKCLGCGGDLVFSGAHQALFCANCGRVHTFDKKNNIIKLNFESEMLKEKIFNASKNVNNKTELNNNELDNNKLNNKNINLNNNKNNLNNNNNNINNNLSNNNSELNKKNDEFISKNNAKFNENVEFLQEKTAKNPKKITTNCKNCGAEFEIKNREMTFICPYCGSSFVLDQTEIFKPNNIIPFAFNKQKAVEYYKQNVKRKWFLPNKFKKQPNVDSVTGTYISCFSFDSFTRSTYRGTLVETTKTYRDGQWHESSTTKHISGKKDLQFTDVIVESSRLTNQKSFDEIKPFIINNETCFEFNKNFLRGYHVEGFDNHPSNCKKISEELMKVEIKNQILRGYSYDYVQYLNLSTVFENNKFSYILVPVYFINFNYKNKSYRTYLNGQTGRIGNDLPKSGVKITFTVLLGILIFFLIFVLPFLLS